MSFKNTIHQEKNYVDCTQEIEARIKAWTPKPLVNTSLLKVLPMEGYVIDSKVKFQIFLFIMQSISEQKKVLIIMMKVNVYFCPG